VFPPARSDVCGRNKENTMTPRPLPFLTPALAAAALGLTLTPAHAQVIFGVSGNASGVIRSGGIGYTDSESGSEYYDPVYGHTPPVPITTTGTAQVVGDGIDNAGTAGGEWSSYAGWDRLGVATSASATASLPLESFFSEVLTSVQAYAVSSLTVQNLVISGPGAFATISLNLLFNSAMSADLAVSSEDFYSSSQSSVSFSSSLSGAVGSQGVFDGDWGLSKTSYSESESSRGLLGPDYHGGPVELTTGRWRVPTGTPLTLSLSLSAGSYVDVRAWDATERSGTSAVDAYHSLSLPLDGPVFNLPDGYAADAPSYGIVDNVFTPVPEPGEYAALAGLGLLGFGLWRRARRPANGPVPRR
jgi:hypothetical protein